MKELIERMRLNMCDSEKLFMDRKAMSELPKYVKKEIIKRGGKKIKETSEGDVLYKFRDGSYMVYVDDTQNFQWKRGDAR